MPKRLAIMIAGLGMLLPFALPASAATLHVGDRAPNFTLPDQNGQSISLSQFWGKKNVVLAFYVLAFTSG